MIVNLTKDQDTIEKECESYRIMEEEQSHSVQEKVNVSIKKSLKETAIKHLGLEMYSKIYKLISDRQKDNNGKTVNLNSFTKK